MPIWAVIMVNPSKAAGVFSPCGLYRYRLEREVGKLEGQINDATIRKVDGFAMRGGADRYIVGNLAALIATDVRELRNAADPIGPDNDMHLEQIMCDADFHWAAWGSLNKLPPKLRSRWLRICSIADRVGCKLHCIGTAKDGHPLHPLMPGYDTPMIEWKRP